jgi:hypothetical protein
MPGFVRASCSRRVRQQCEKRLVFKGFLRPAGVGGYGSLDL